MVCCKNIVKMLWMYHFSLLKSFYILEITIEDNDFIIISQFLY